MHKVNEEVYRIIAVLLIPVFIFFVLTYPSYKSMAEDIDIYSSGATVKPNVIIILDNSTAMGGTLQYDDNQDYSYTGSSYASTSWYDIVQTYTRQNKNDPWGLSSTTATTHSGAVTDANLDGISDAGTLRNPTTIDDNTKTYTVSYTSKGNRINYDYRVSLPSSNSLYLGSKFEAAKNALANAQGTGIIQLLQNEVRFGSMLFKTQGSSGAKSYGDGGQIKININDQPTPSEINGLINIPSTQFNVPGSPFAETLADAGLYYKATSGNIPIQYSCQKNFVIIISGSTPSYDMDAYGEHMGTLIPKKDGTSGASAPADWDQYNANETNTALRTADDVSLFNSSGDYIALDSYSRDEQNSSKTQHYLDDVADYLYKHDMRPDLAGQQNVRTYTVGFGYGTSDPAINLLQLTAQRGDGLYFNGGSDTMALKNALFAAIADIVKRLQTFTTPVVPISRTVSGTNVYLAFFKPRTYNTFWPGDVKKFGIDLTSANGEVIRDKNGDPATDTATGAILDQAVAYWSANDQLKARTTARNIYSDLDSTNLNLYDDVNRFTVSNVTGLISPTRPGGGSSPADAVTALVNFIYGFDSYDDDGDGNVSEKRDEILGDILHSTPLVYEYFQKNADGSFVLDAAGNKVHQKSVIFFGANDGMLHALDDTTGDEMWGFIPKPLLGKLKNLNNYAADKTENHAKFVDGPPKVKEIYDADGHLQQVIMIFGLRSGGNNYYALDITDPDHPKKIWSIQGGTGDFAELGDTWSEPQIGKIKVGSTDKNVLIVGGGYPNASQSYNSIGRGVFMVDLLTGALVKKFVYGTSNTSSTSVVTLTDMKYSIPSMVGMFDTDNDGYINRLYVGDLGGRMWRFGNDNDNDNGDDPDVTTWKARILFKANGSTDPVTTDSSSSTVRRIFYAPEVSLEKDNAGRFDYVFFGTGDRENPTRTTVTDRIYAIKDRTSYTPQSETWTPKIEGDLVDVTTDQLQDSTTSATTISTLNCQLGVTNYGCTASTLSGWFIQLNQNAGEKVLASPVLFANRLIFNTFTPATGTCVIGGIARSYVLDRLNGNAILDFYSGNGTDLARADRAKEIGYGIPSSPVIAIDKHGNATAIIGGGEGAVTLPNFKMPKGLRVTSWKEVF